MMANQLCSPSGIESHVADAALVVLLALPHFLYAFIWFKPDVWRGWFGKQAIPMFATLGAAGKVLQFSAVLMWLWSVRPDDLCFSLKNISLLQWQAALLLGSLGQSLNLGIFKAIGVEGVYYGFKLGHTVEWVTGWPFNFCSHPQYVGSILTILSAGSLLWGQIPDSSLMLGAFWISLYLITSVQEQYF